ncbi:MAG: hypothetical protein F4X82_02410 [Candidatus Spechtbacteria bacterium SB0662_bin_43]|uniref:Uncharacterized protein n=1 Tax=Candidatus Spechtbacteria bacterium SB0662_bin_43 TaxID=2604897 RepID=A0A845DLY8_9BACT|nr:hypothetical protein [Candidatus Spechtbacteria bacterium SB0662_bin_43]
MVHIQRVSFGILTLTALFILCGVFFTQIIEARGPNVSYPTQALCDTRCGYEVGWSCSERGSIDQECERIADEMNIPPDQRACWKKDLMGGWECRRTDCTQDEIDNGCPAENKEAYWNFAEGQCKCRKIDCGADFRQRYESRGWTCEWNNQTRKCTCTAPNGERRVECDPNKQICNPIKSEDFDELVNGIIRWITLFSVPIFTLMVVYAGFLYTTSAGSSTQTQKAVSVIKYAVIGFIIVGLAYVIKAIVGDIL